MGPLGGLGMTELVVVFLVVVVLFGAKRLPEIGQSLGSGIREFRDSFKELHDDDDDEPKRLR